MRKERAEIHRRHRAGEVDAVEASRLLDMAAVMSDGSRKEAGVVYTPRFLAEAMCSMLSPSPEDTVLEPSCGRGAFVFSLLSHMEKTFGMAPSSSAAWGERMLRACDLDAEAVEDLAMLWRDRFSRLGVLSDISANLKTEDSLFAGWSGEKFSCVIGNPPYVRIQNLSEGTRAALRASFPSCAKGNVDIYHAFCEKALAQAERVCFVMPNGWMTTASGRSLRVSMLPRLSKLVDFGSRLVFAPVRAYVCVFLAEQAERCRDTFSLGGDMPSADDEAGAWVDVRRDDPRLAPSGWKLSSDTAANVASQTLADFADVLCGVATLADSAFVSAASSPATAGKVTLDSVPGSPSVRISQAPRFFKATKLTTRKKLLSSSARIVCPYDSSWKIIPETKVDKAALAALSLSRARLDARDRGKVSGYEAWYAFGRRQGLHTIPAGRTVFLVPVMASGPLTPVGFKPSEVGGRFLFSSGYLVVPRREADAAAVRAALSSPELWKLILSEGRKWAGGKDYRTFSSKLLRSFPVSRGQVHGAGGVSI